MKKDLGKIYQDRAEQYSSDLDKIKRQINLIAIGRMAVFILGSCLSIYLYYINIYLAVLSFLVFASLYVFLIKVHNELFSEKLRLVHFVQVNNEEITRLNGNSEFDTGLELLDIDHPYASDLDIFGNGSLFQNINRTCGIFGKKRLSSWLCQPEDETEILLRQQAVIELKDKLDWRQEFQVVGRMTSESEQDLNSILNWIGETTFFVNHKVYKYLLIILPLLTLSLFALSAFLIPVGIPIAFVLIQFGIIMVNIKKINNQHAQTSKKFTLLAKYQGQISIMENESFASERLVDLKDILTKSSSGRSAKSDIADLARIINDFDKRLHMIFGTILNGLFMWDLQCVLRLEKWKIKCKDKVEKWFEAIGAVDALSSLACFYYNNPEFAMPETSKDYVLKASNLGHPLINEEERICNDIEITEFGKFMLITGSNMAGKSTFLRTLGINLVLAMSGAPTCAEFFKFYPIQIYTNMRILDSLNSGESTFYAELKRLKTIISVLDKEQKVMILFDEILTGTNSRDKHIGSETLIRQLIEKKGTGIIATHDLDLGNMAKQYPENISNHCFEVTMKDEKFVYDYKLKEGICQTMNATDLMRKMGITIKEE